MSIRIPREELFKRIGYQDQPQSRLLDVADEMIEALAALAEPKRGFKAFRDKNDLPPFLLGATLKYSGALTLGPKLEDRVRDLFSRGKSVEAYILDTVGSVAVSLEGDQLWDEIRKHAASRGFNKGLRRSPGCRGIEMETQRWIFERMKDLDLGIALTQSGMMVPRKSLSFLARFGGHLQGTLSCEGCKHYAECSL